MIPISAQMRNCFLCSLLLIGFAHADPNGFTFSTITFAASSNTIAYGVNNKGQIVGSEDAAGIINGFLSSGGTSTIFNAPGAILGSYAEGINNNGQIVGLNFANSGYLLNGGFFTAITVPGSDSGTTNPIGINDSGQIVGTFLKGGVGYGFLLSAGVYTTIAVPGATSTFAWGINNSGQIVGSFTSNGVTSGFLLSGGAYTTLMYPGSASTKAFGINNSGQIVGQYSMGGTMSGFLLEGGNYTAIGAPGSTNTSAIGINDAGQIVGSYVSGGTTLGFSATQNAQSVSFNEYPVPNMFPTSPNEIAFPTAITSGPDGALWFIVGGGAIGRITTSGVVTEYPVPGNPQEGGITSGPDGALWFTAGNSIQRITTSGVVTAYPLPANTSAGGITTGPDGALWFTSFVFVPRGPGSTSQIGRITTSGVITIYPLPSLGSAPSGIVAGPDGALWFTETFEGAPASIGRITTDGLSVAEYPLPTTTTTDPTAITVGPDGALWFAETNRGNIGRITTSGAITEFPLPAPNARLSGITAGPDGALWLTDSDNARIWRITTSGELTQYALPISGLQPFGIVIGPDGGVWFSANSTSSLPVPEIVQMLLVPNPSVPPALSITKTHTGSFSQSQASATYTVVVSNAIGAGVTNDVVTVTDTLPSGLTLVSMVGTGWTCVSNSCMRSDPLPGGAIYPSITVTVSVTPTAGSPLINSVSVSGGGSAGASASDSTVITPNPPLLGIRKTHTGNFGQGQSNAVYTVTVFNNGGPPNGIVTVTEMPPAGETLVSMAGMGWNCTGATCTRSDVPNLSYPVITVTVNVAANASSPQVNQVSVSGGGSASTSTIADSTVIVPTGQGSLTVTPIGGSTFTYALGLYGPTPFGLTLSVASNPTGAAFTVTPSANLTSNVTSGTTPGTLTISINTAAVTTAGPQSGAITVSVPNSALGCASPVTVAGQSVCTVTVPYTIDVQPAFFEGESTYGSGGFYNIGSFGIFDFASYNPLTIYHLTLGFEGIFPSTDASRGIYFFDYATGHIWYTNPAILPYFYDFTANAWLYYFGGNATQGGRSFYNFGGASASAGYTTPGFIFL